MNILDLRLEDPHILHRGKPVGHLLDLIKVLVHRLDLVRVASVNGVGVHTH
jgi:hypothetical protein